MKKDTVLIEFYLSYCMSFYESSRYLACWGQWRKLSRWQQTGDTEAPQSPLPEPVAAGLLHLGSCALLPHSFTVSVGLSFSLPFLHPFHSPSPSAQEAGSIICLSLAVNQLSSALPGGLTGKRSHVREPCEQFPSQGQLWLHTWIPICALI